MKQRLRHILILVPAILLIVLAYSPGLHGPYVLDDGENITQNRAVAIHDLSFNSIHQALTSNESGPLKRPLAALSFAINHYAAGGFDNSFPFKLANLLIHLINAALLYGLTLLLLRTSAIATSVPSRLRPYLAGVTTLMWALHPLQLTTVLYVVQRMNSLSAMFVLLGLLLFCRGRHMLASSPRYGLAMMYSGVVLGTLLGLGAKENAALLPLFALTIEYTLFRRESLVPAIRRQLRWFYLLSVVTPVVLFVGYLLAYPEFVTDAYAERRFTPLERLMTQPRVLWFYLSLILLPSTHRLGLFHDDLAVSSSLLNPLTTLPAIAALMAIFIFAAWKVRKYPIASFTILWFLAGHLLESSIFGLEVAYEHRNYMPSFGIIFGIVMATATLFRRMRLRETSWIAPSIIVAIVLTFSTFSRATTWSDIHLLAEHSASHHPDSPRSNDFAARVELAYARNPVRAINYVIQGLQAEPSEAGFHIDLQILLETLSQDVNATLIAHRQASAAQQDGLTVTGLPDTVRVTAAPSGVKMVYSASNSGAILQLLRNQPITVHTIVSLENLRKCIVENPHSCQRLAADARDWLAVASENSLTSPEYHAMIHSNLAQLYADMNNIARAYEHISHASRIAPEEESYRLGKIDYLIRLDQLAEAGKLLAPYLETDTKKASARTTNQDTVQRLKERYRLAAEKMGGSQRSP